MHRSMLPGLRHFSQSHDLSQPKADAPLAHFVTFLWTCPELAEGSSQEK
jgi:hypothetical protein